MPFDVVEVGSTVLILRNDGQVHPAVVSKVNEKKEHVVVEWEEDGIYKGKTVPMFEILELNAAKFKPKEPPRSWAEVDGRDRPEPKGVDPTKGRDAGLSDRKSFIVKKSPKQICSSSEESTDHEKYFSGGSHISVQSKISVRSKASSRIPRVCASMVAKPKQTLSKGIAGRTLPTIKVNRATLVTKVPTQEAATIRPRTMSTEVKKTLLSVVPRPPASTTGCRQPATPVKLGIRPQTSQKEDHVVTFVRQLDIERAQKRLENNSLRAEIAYRKSMSKHWEVLKMIEDYRNSINIEELSVDEKTDSRIMVCIRKRPLSDKEIAREEIDIMTVPNDDHIVAHELKHKVDSTKYIVNQCFRYDHVFDEFCSTEQVYEHAARPLVEAMFRGGNATCFAFGQTGSGKTYTMGGATTSDQDSIYAYVVRDVFEMMNAPRYHDPETYLVASYYEIYGSKIFDLLEKKAQLSIMEDRHGHVRVCKLSETVVTSADQVRKLIHIGNKTRTSGRTSANDNSSRSHAIFQLAFRSGVRGRDQGKLSLIDLAGNERGTDNTSTEKKSRKETGEINKALLVLKECIRAMSKEEGHLPFRGSKLTHVLRDSFLGPLSKTCMIATVSPGINSVDHSIDTLRYADRVKGLKVKDHFLGGGRVEGI